MLQSGFKKKQQHNFFLKISLSRNTEYFSFQENDKTFM